MSAVSGSPTQNATSVLTALELSGVPDDAFKAGDLAFVSSTGKTYQLRRTALVGAPSGTTTVATFSGNGYWLDISALPPLSVPNIAALVALDDALMAIGQKVYVASVRSDWELQAGVDPNPDAISIVVGSSGTRSWYRQSDAVVWTDVATFYVNGGAGDLVWSVGGDENDGTSRTTPIASLDELNRRVSGRSAIVPFECYIGPAGAAGQYLVLTCDADFFGNDALDIGTEYPVSASTQINRVAGFDPISPQKTTCTGITWKAGNTIYQNLSNNQLSFIIASTGPEEASTLFENTPQVADDIRESSLYDFNLYSLSANDRWVNFTNLHMELADVDSARVLGFTDCAITSTDGAWKNCSEIDVNRCGVNDALRIGVGSFLRVRQTALRTTGATDDVVITLGAYDSGNVAGYQGASLCSISSDTAITGIINVDNGSGLQLGNQVVGGLHEVGDCGSVYVTGKGQVVVGATSDEGLSTGNCHVSLRFDTGTYLYGASAETTPFLDIRTSNNRATYLNKAVLTATRGAADVWSFSDFGSPTSNPRVGTWANLPASSDAPANNFTGITNA